MDMKTFGYLYYKTRGYAHDDILKNAEITEEEYEFFEKNLQDVLKEIETLRPVAENIGQDFVRLTRYIYERESDQTLGVQRPDAVKARVGEIVSLPAIGTLTMPDMPLAKAIEQRRSRREYSQEALKQEELSFLLWASSWARDFRSTERMELTFRNVPSAGSRHPIETFLDIRRVEGIKPGLYYYHPIKHCLILYDNSEQIAAKIHEGCMFQEMISNAAVNFILTAVPYRTVWRYGQRGYRYLYLDAGHIGQNIHLAAEAIDAGACMIGAFLDEAMNEALGLDGIEEFVIYISSVGKKP
ncbi:MAG TPA: SagB/ThcOx family dehydrogenase [Candidatus Cloacimonas sp.]|jgi:SagB-type dehydrogenase family enzyme|nr:SagB/ThcOx family dehydrogenase [Candidatus Cloacimonas sp.]MDD2250485.1 SagB/ThcOx family dehydrogenase [Candidatus Cloacimonadota bacterium]MCK9157490.1 SagB/ThcOx family dehydrogenase [Candidatus Cloacimonas sp.]MCK9165112.1 SagB/ThcOx family dehydrogenase [Candidatus Cloacimonas sp.]MDD3734270.1 SagB/ThcOx family dehydrogenase [Candidatus Cloacimonadota bacterium]